MDRDELAEHVVVADDEPRRLAAVLQVLRRQADRRQRRDVGVIADLASSRRRRSTRRAGTRGRSPRAGRPSRTARSTVPGPIFALGMDDRGRVNDRSGVVPAGSSAMTRSASATTWPPTDATAASRAMRAAAAAHRHARARADRRARPGAGTSRCPRRAATRSDRRGSPSANSSRLATCVSDSIISTPGMSGVPGKCPWKNSSFTVTFLTATMRRPGSWCGDGVDEHRRIAVGQALEGGQDAHSTVTQ